MHDNYFILDEDGIKKLIVGAGAVTLGLYFAGKAAITYIKNEHKKLKILEEELKRYKNQ